MRPPLRRSPFPALLVLACLSVVFPSEAQITAAVAANVRYAMEELKADFGKS